MIEFQRQNAPSLHDTFIGDRYRTIRYADYRFDNHGNWIRTTATAFNSKRPDVLLYQYNEIREIEYYPDPTPVQK